ncbi:MAG: acyltransferase [Bacteroidota bacterium]
MRNKDIDFLRGFAIILVLFRHHDIISFLSTAGGAGVDLFFVLSGFLIGGLLFVEYKNFGNLKIGLFLIRRGFKIYPSYYLTMAVVIGWTVISCLKNNIPIPIQSILLNLFFLQNYYTGSPLWIPAWSLAVEEHFYFLLPLCLLWFIGRNKFNNSKAFPKLFIYAAITCLVLRYITIYTLGMGFRELGTPTHLRIDSLLFGVLIAYYYHFAPATITKVYFKFRYTLLFFACAVFIWQGMPDFNLIPFEIKIMLVPINFSLLYLASGVLIVATLSDAGATMLLKKITTKPVYEFVAFTGFYSYNIYLWHLWGGILLNAFLYRKFPILVQYPILPALFYFATAFGLGIGITHLVEIPFLSLRDRFFPRRSKKAKLI